MERRDQYRVTPIKATVDLNDGRESYLGTVNDASYTGVSVDIYSKKMNRKAVDMMITVYQDDQAYYMRGIPKWIKEHDSKTSIGLKIFEAPQDWYQFLDSFSPYGTS